MISFSRENGTPSRAATQLTILSDYQGYGVTTILGFEVSRRAAEDQDAQIRTRGFATVYAGVER